MNLRSFEYRRVAEEGVRVPLLDPVTGEATGAALTLRGRDAPTLKAIELEQRRRRLEQLARDGIDRVEPQQRDEEELEMLVAATVGWEGLELDGEAVPFSAEKARWFYTEFPCFLEQARLAIVKRANFSPRSASGS